MKEDRFSILTLLKSVVGVVLCLLLQGCGWWSGGNRAINDWTPRSTIITPEVGTDENDGISAVVTEPDYSPVSIKEVLNPPASTSSIRALPRRPEVEEVMEENVLEITSPIMFEPETKEIVPQLTMYVVAKGDTLSKIAHEFHVTIDQIVRENSLKNKNSLSIGQVLMIPQSGGRSSFLEPSNGGVHVVQTGDTLSKLAVKYHTTVAHLKVINKLSSDRIRLGQKLKISQSDVPAAAKPSIRADMTPIVGEKYTVKAGDSLWTIAKRSGLTVNQLKDFNHLSSDVLMVGRELTLKAPAPVHVVPAISEPEELPTEVSSQLLDNSLPADDFKSESTNLEEEDFEDLIDSGDDMPVSINYVR